MSARKTCISTAVIVALFVCAFSTASASALSITAHKCGEAAGTSGFTYTTNSCTTVGKEGKFQRIPFTSEGIEITNPSTVTIRINIAGARLKIVCTGTSAKTTATDMGESIAGSPANFTFSGCVVTEPSGKGCVVRSGGAAFGVITTVQLSSTITRTGTETYKQIIKPSSGTVLFSFEVSGCSATFLNGTKSLTGFLSANVTGNMKSEFTETSGSEFLFGGQKESFLGTWEHKTTSTGGLISFGS